MLVIQGVASHLPVHMEEELQVDLWVEMRDASRCISIKAASFCRMWCNRKVVLSPSDPDASSETLMIQIHLSFCHQQILYLNINIR